MVQSFFFFGSFLFLFLFCSSPSFLLIHLLLQQYINNSLFPFTLPCQLWLLRLDDIWKVIMWEIDFKFLHFRKIHWFVLLLSKRFTCLSHQQEIIVQIAAHLIQQTQSILVKICTWLLGDLQLLLLRRLLAIRLLR